MPDDFDPSVTGALTMRFRPWLVAAVMAASVLPGAALAAVTWLSLRAHYHSALGDAISVRDYLNVWGAGRLIELGRVDILFHPLLYGEWLQTVFGPDLVRHTWSYPPSMVFVAIPLSFLGLVPGFVAWTAGTLAVLWGVLRACRLPLLTCLAVLVSPAVIENALAGQNGALTAAMLEGGLLLVGGRPMVAGVLFGLLTTKPQLGLLVPVCLVASGRWVTIGVAAATGLLLMAVSSLAFGVSAWVWYLTDVRHFMTAEILEQPFGAGFQKLMATPFILARWFDAPLRVAYVVQASVTLCCVGITWAAWRRPGTDPKARMALTASLALLATPYGYSYDTIGTAVGVAVLGTMALETRFRPFEGILLAVAWAWPGLAFWMGNAAMPPVGCVTLAAAAISAWRRLSPESVVVT
jgi:hypothetical protein